MECECRLYLCNLNQSVDVRRKEEFCLRLRSRVDDIPYALRRYSVYLNLL